MGYVGVIVLQQLAITGLLCAILHLLNRLRRMDGIARARLRTNPAHFRPANRERSYLHFDGLFSEAVGSPGTELEFAL